MLKILLELLANEKELVFKERAKGKFVIRPSSVIMIIFSILYLLSSIDIILEGLIEPKACGYIDDLVVLILTGYVVYLDIGGEFNGNSKVSNGKVQKKGRHSRQNSVPNKNKSIPKSNDATNTSNDMQSSSSTKQGTSSNTGDSSDGVIFDGILDNDIGDSKEADRKFEEQFFEEEDGFIL